MINTIFPSTGNTTGWQLIPKLSHFTCIPNHFLDTYFAHSSFTIENLYDLSQNISSKSILSSNMRGNWEYLYQSIAKKFKLDNLVSPSTCMNDNHLYTRSGINYSTTP